MRLSEEQLLEAITHPDWDVRETAIEHFSITFSQDRRPFARVIEAIETYGWDEAPDLHGHAGVLPLSLDTAPWIIQQFAAPPLPTDEWREHGVALAKKLVRVDADILGAVRALADAEPNVPFVTQAALAIRHQLSSTNPEQTWRKLAASCRRLSESGDLDKDEYAGFSVYVELLARHTQRFTDEMAAVLRAPMGLCLHHESTWMQLALIRWAGLNREEQAIDLIVPFLGSENERQVRESILALAHIGTDDVLNAIRRAYDRLDQAGRNNAADVIARIYSGLALETARTLFQEETDPLVQGMLADALLLQFSPEAIELVRAALLDESLEDSDLKVRQRIVTVSTLLDIDFPEREAWREECDDDDENADRDEVGWGDNFDSFWRLTGELLARLETSGSKRNAQPTLSGPPPVPVATDTIAPVAPVETVVRTERVGRNAPCPCGSGKKFKQCCLMRRGQAR